MGLSKNPRTDQIYKRADELGWDLCPAEAAVYLRIAYKNQLFCISHMECGSTERQEIILLGPDLSINHK